MKIWGDRWVPGIPSGKISSPQHYFLEDVRVHHLIDPGTKRWKIRVIQHIFSQEEATHILGITLSNHFPPDKLYWPHMPSGNFSVRSAYQMLMQVDLPSVNHTPDPNWNSITWSSIWGLQVPPKVRHFLWHACTKSLPRKKNLHRRHIPIDPLYNECHQFDEDVLHVLWSCKSAMLLWNRSEQFRLFQTAQFTSFNELLKHIFDNLDESHHRTFTVQA